MVAFRSSMMVTITMILLAWDCLLGPLGLVSAADVAVTRGRTDAQRRGLCDAYDAETKAWNDETEGKMFRIMKRKTYSSDYLPDKGCIGWPTSHKKEVRCDSAPKKWQWMQHPTLKKKVLVNRHNFGPFSFDYCITVEAFPDLWRWPLKFVSWGVQYCYFTDPPAAFYVAPASTAKQLVRPAHCPCGQDFKGGTAHGTCWDIDECQEQNGCPENSFCTNTAGDYSCTCNPGYVHPESGGAQVPKFATCVESVSFQPHAVGPLSFKMDISKVGSNKAVTITLFQVAEEAANLLVPVQRYSKMKSTFSSFSQVKTFSFDDLTPGARYKMELTFDDNDVTKTSDYVITKCFCLVLEGEGGSVDESGRPENAVATQDEGFIMFTFVDNSRCEDAYSFSRIDPEATPKPEPEVFASDYYYFSAQECAGEPYSPGFQAADDLRLSKLTVGKVYDYQIRASARQPWRRSDVTTISHTVQWQASIDGQVTLTPDAGGLPVQDVTVDYRLEDHSGVILSVCDSATYDGWCRTTTSPSGKFRIDFSLVDDSLNNDDDFPVRLRYGKQTGSIKHRFLCGEGTRDCSADLAALDDDSASDSVQSSPQGDDPFGDMMDAMMDAMMSPDSDLELSPENIALFSTFNATTPVSPSMPLRREYKKGSVLYNSSVVYVRHLEFNAPVHVIDDTTVSFRGRISVNGTSLPFEEDLGCAIPLAEVCLIDHATRNKIQVQEPICVMTDGNGEYALPAVIGTTVSPQVNYHFHDFEAVNPAHAILFSQGIRIEPDGNYDGFDLADTTTTSLAVEVAGGFCNHKLGVSDVRLTIQGCLWEGVVLTQDQYRQEHNVVAQFVDLSVEDIRGRDGNSRGPIIRALSSSRDSSIDLRDLEEEDELASDNSPEGSGSATSATTSNGDSTASSLDETEVAGNSTNATTNEVTMGNENATVTSLDEKSEAGAEVTDLKLVRFQYNGQDHLRTVFGERADITGCGSDAESKYVDSYSYHVIRMLSLFEVRVFAWQEFGYDDIPVCTKYEPNTTIFIDSEVGVANSQIDRLWIEMIEAKPEYAGLAERLRDCSPLESICQVVLEMDSTGSNAQASKLLVSGQPNPFQDNTKSLQVTLGSIRHQADVVVTGDFELPGGFTVAIPSHKPILVLRDPPGGGSYSFYENMITTARVTMEHYETYTGFESALTANFGVGLEIESCWGLGAEVCNEAVDVEKLGMLDREVDESIVTHLVDGSDSASFTTTWSYRTSTDEWVAGESSDVFLVPNLNAKFKDITEVRFVGAEWSDTCTTAEDKLKFALESPENKPAIGFLSRYDIESVEIPDLKRLKEAAVVDAVELGCPDTLDDIDDSTPSDCEKFIVNRDVFTDALEDWGSFLERHDNITKMAKIGGLDAAKPGVWFNRIRDKSDNAALLPKQHYSSVIPKKLADQAEQVRFLSGDSSASKAGSEELEHINLIKFDGGGAEIRFELKEEYVHEHTQKIGRPEDNMKEHSTIGAGRDFKLDSPVVVGIDFDAHNTEETDRVHELTDSDADTTVIGFVLSDPDSGDVFDVEVFLDPDYGTFVFSTISGRSKCPNEKGTVLRESPVIVANPMSSAIPLPDDPIVFEVNLTNAGVSPAAFQLFTEHRSNSGVLGHLANGDTLTVPQQYDRIDPGETITTYVSIYRGPVHYDHAPFKLFFRSACENVRNIGDGNLIALGDGVASDFAILSNVIDPSFPEGQQERMRFAEPCPGIEWEGDLATDQSFRVNLVDKKSPNSVNILVRNPQTQSKSFAKMADDVSGRFLEAGLWFRQIGTSLWHRAGSEDGRPINFAKLTEDDFGWIEAQWFVGGLPDGSYEIEARSICKATDGVPVDFRSSSTPRISGTIDRERPDLFGGPSPRVDNRLFPGEFFVFHFTEALQCLQPFVFDVEVTLRSSSTSQDAEIFDEEQLRIVCEDRLIRVAFNSRLVNYVHLLGTYLTITVTGVEDLNGNPIDPLSPVIHSVQYASPADMSHENVGFQIVFPFQEFNQDTIMKQLVETTGLPSDRIQIRSLAPLEDDKTTASVLLDPSPAITEQGGAWRTICRRMGWDCGSDVSRDATAGDDVSALEAFYRMKDSDGYVTISEPLIQSPLVGVAERSNNEEIMTQDGSGRRLETSSVQVDLGSDPLQLLMETIGAQTKSMEEIKASQQASQQASQRTAVVFGAPLVLLSIGLVGYVVVLSHKVKSLEISGGYSRV